MEEVKSSKDWFNALELSKKELKEWISRGDKVVKRYRDERSELSGGKRYNILWSNIRTLLPAVYAKKPKAECERRHKDADPVGRCASQVLERALQYEIDHYPDFDSSLRNSVLDRLLPGRGVAWIRYEPHYAAPEEAQVTDDVELKEMDYECSPADYVFWKDFRHSPARTWEEVTWVARRVYMAKAEGVKRFGDDFKTVPLGHEPIGLDEMKRDGVDVESMKKAIVWEIWDKPTQSAIWVAEGHAEVLDEKPDPLQLDEFFPCPKPLFATMTTDSLVPIADYVMYQDQAAELDTLTERIAKLVEAVKVVGVYDASQTGLQRMLNEGVDNTLIPVDTWAAFGEKGGLKGTIDFLPLDMVVMSLEKLYQAREAAKQVIYEVTGLSDIIRGASVASETATAQQIKSQYASLRLKEMQTDVARFASDILRIKAQIMCSFYRPESLIEMSGMAQTKDAQYLPQAIELLQNANLRSFRIEIESDSLVELDEVQEKQDRMEFLAAAGQFIEKAIQAPPELAPLLGEMMMFGVRSFKAGKGMEASLEQFIEAATEKAKNPGPPQPNPEMMKLQAQQQTEQAKLQAAQQADAMKRQADAQIAQQSAAIEAQLEQQRMAHAEMLEQSKQEHEKVLKQMELDATAQREAEKNQLDNATKIQVARISAKSAMDTASLAAGNAASDEILEDFNDEGIEVQTPVQKLAEMHGEAMSRIEQLMQHIAKPKMIIKGPDGRAIGVQ